MVCPVLGVDIPYCGDDQAKNVQFCTSKNDTMIDFNISPEDFHVNVTSLVRMFTQTGSSDLHAKCRSSE